MADGRAAYDPDRLPWLTDERKPRSRRGLAPLLPWALLAALLVAGVSYWLGMRSVTNPDEFADIFRTSPPEATVRLPEAAIAPPSPQIRPPALTEVPLAAEPAPVPLPRAEPVRPPRAEPDRRASAPAKARAAPRKARARSAPAKRTATASRSARLEAWPAAVSDGAYGRVARIGTFSSRRQAKKGWWAIVRHYPGMKRLKAVVAPVPSLRTGQTLYRLQFGTTSQAHSEVLCQRMRIIGQSCVVVGLPARQEARK